jgi:hypothetical protein
MVFAATAAQICFVWPQLQLQAPQLSRHLLDLLDEVMLLKQILFMLGYSHAV